MFSKKMLSNVVLRVLDFQITKGTIGERDVGARLTLVFASFLDPEIGHFEVSDV